MQRRKLVQSVWIKILVMMHIFNTSTAQSNTAPIFSQAQYTFSIYESYESGTDTPGFGFISAVDTDVNQTATLRYSLIATANGTLNGTTFFGISESTGEIFFKPGQKLDYELMKELGQTFFQIVVSVIDNPPVQSEARSASAFVIINVLDSDDLPPEMNYSNCVVSFGRCAAPMYEAESSLTSPLEFFPIIGGVKRATSEPIAAYDGDYINQPIVFSIRSVYPVSESLTFQVSTSGPTSQAGRDVYTASVRQNQHLSDIGGATLILEVVQTDSTTDNARTEHVVAKVVRKRENFFPPVMYGNGAGGYIEENSAEGTSVRNNRSNGESFFFTVVDDDLTENEPCRVYKFSTNDPTFRVNPDTYTLESTVSTLDYETKTSYTFSVIVAETDTAVPRSGTIQVTVFVVDRNDVAPTFSQLQYTVFSKGMPNELITQLSASDGDSGVNAIVTYTIDTIFPEDQSSFVIDSQQGQIFHNTVADPGEYLLQVRATDSPIPPDIPLFGLAVVTVVVISEVNSTPVFRTAVTTVNINESSPVLTVVHQAVAFSSDTGGFLIYSMSGSSDFRIDTNTGIVRNVVALDREVTASYTYILTAVDTSAPNNSGTATLSIIITDVNDNPPAFEFCSYTFTVNENDIGALVGTDTAIDHDDPNTDNSQIDYTLDEAKNLFAIDVNTGRIHTKTALDYEQNKEHTFRAVAHDRGVDPLSGITIVRVTVSDLNDNIPMFPDPQIVSAFVQQGVLNAVITTVQATDADASDTIVYKFVHESGDAAFFSINSNEGTISNNKAFDYELGPRDFTFLVTTQQAETAGQVSGSYVTKVVIIVTEFQPGNINVSSPSVPTGFNYIPAERTTSSVSLVWAEGHSGNLKQSFNLRYKLFEDTAWSSFTVQEGGPDHQVSFTGLKVGSDYEFRISAYNAVGNSSEVGPLLVNTKEEQSDTPSVDISVIAGGVVAGLLVGILVTVVLSCLYFRRRGISNRKQSTDASAAKAGTTSASYFNKLTQDSITPSSKSQSTEYELEVSSVQGTVSSTYMVPDAQSEETRNKQLYSEPYEDLNSRNRELPPTYVVLEPSADTVQSSAQSVADTMVSSVSGQYETLDAATIEPSYVTTYQMLEPS